MTMARASERYDSMGRYDSTSASSFSPKEQYMQFNGHGHGFLDNGGQLSLEAKLEQFRKSDSERDAMFRV